MEGGGRDEGGRSGGREGGRRGRRKYGMLPRIPTLVRPVTSPSVNAYDMGVGVV